MNCYNFLFSFFATEDIKQEIPELEEDPEYTYLSKHQSSNHGKCSNQHTQTGLCQCYAYDEAVGVVPKDTYDLWKAQEERSNQRYQTIFSIGSRQLPPVRLLAHTKPSEWEGCPLESPDPIPVSG